MVKEETADIKRKQTALATQNNIPSFVRSLDGLYPHVTWSQANTNWRNAVGAVLIRNNVDILIDIPWGEGFVEAKHLFMDYMKITEEYMKSKKNSSKENNP